MKRLGIGWDLYPVSYGPHITYYSNNWIFAFTYGLPQSSYSHDILKEFNNSFYFHAAYSIAYWYSSISFWPIYLGVGYNYILEKNKVLEFEGDGTISSFSFYVGAKLIEFKKSFFRNFGTHLELGYTSWNYSNSLLEKNSSDIEYNYSSFYFSLGIYYYLL
jgi:hypothetical protein